MNDTILIDGLQANAVIGVYEWERGIRQPIHIDLELATDVRRGARNDCIDDAVDYAAVSARVLDIVENSTYRLIESLAEQLATTLLEEFDIGWLRLRVNKPTAVAAAQCVAVVIERGHRGQVV